MAARNYAQYCGIVTGLELVGERWALLIVRDLLVGPRRYSDLKNGLPRIPTNILSTRLKELQEAGVVRRVPLTHRGLIYELTDFGQGLEDVVLALGRWGFQAMGDPADGDVITSDSLTMMLRTAFRADAAARLASTVYELRLNDVALRIRVGAQELHIAPAPGASAAPVPASKRLPDVPELVISTGPGIRALIARELTPAQAIAGDVVRVVAGDPALLERFAETFHLPSPAPVEDERAA